MQQTSCAGARVISIGLFLFMVMGSCSPDPADRNGPGGRISDAGLEQLASHYKQGKLVFSRYCNTCHSAPERDVLDQYLFDHLFERMPPPAEDYFVRFISDSRALKASGDKYAGMVDEEWGTDYKHGFKDSLSATDFSNLIAYIRIAARQRYLPKQAS